ncbi:hypothetical protein L7F22_001583 [Adiantum nelumboides]|nr:hypothetical protein [Adiantum nelumboides]
MAASTCDYRLALALAVVKARSSQGAALQHWKKKAKARKKELETLQKMLQQQQCDSAVSGILPLPDSCKCSFFQSCDKGFEASVRDVQPNDLDHLLFRQFLRTVNRWNYSNGSQMNKILGSNKHDKLATEGIIADMDFQLIEMTLTYSCNMDSNDTSVDARSWIFQLLTKLGAFCFVGQRMLVMATDQFASVAERLCFVDPFEKNVCQVYNNVMFVLQLIENLLLYHSSCWKHDKYFDEGLLEDWVSVIVKLSKTCAVLGKCNSLFLAYMERITSQMVKQLHRLSNIDGRQGKNLNEACLKFVFSDQVSN